MLLFDLTDKLEIFGLISAFILLAGLSSWYFYF